MKMKDIKVFVIVYFLAILLGIPIGKVSAAPRLSCYGSGCNYRDPATEGCSAITANAAWARGSSSGLLRTDLRWSNSSSCYSNWSRVQNAYYYTRHLKTYLSDQYGNNRVGSKESWYSSQIWTDMYSGAYYNCARGKQGPAGGSFDAFTVQACG